MGGGNEFTYGVHGGDGAWKFVPHTQRSGANNIPIGWARGGIREVE